MVIRHILMTYTDGDKVDKVWDLKHHTTSLSSACLVHTMSKIGHMVKMFKIIT